MLNCTYLCTQGLKLHARLKSMTTVLTVIQAVILCQADFEVQPQPPPTTVLLNTYPFYLTTKHKFSCAITQSYQ